MVETVPVRMRFYIGAVLLVALLLPSFASAGAGTDRAREWVTNTTQTTAA